MLLMFALQLDLFLRKCEVFACPKLWHNNANLLWVLSRSLLILGYFNNLFTLMLF